MNDGPLVTYVMPAWQPRADWFEQACRSVLAQEGARIELVVVDDGSPDPVETLLERFDDPRIRCIRIPHGGMSPALNAGAREAAGDYIRFFDADDAAEPGSTAHLLGLAAGDERVIAYGATTFCDEELRPVWNMRSRVEGRAVEECLLGRFTVRAHALLFPRAVIAATGEWDEGLKVSQDWDYVMRATEHAPVVGSTVPVTRYRRHRGGMTADLEGAQAVAEAIVARYFERHPDQRGTALERRSRAMLEARAARVDASHRRPRSAAGHALRALRIDPRELAGEVARSLPALGGKTRAAVRARPGATIGAQ
jgi:glycosyltransferase involved in cell wall biosynthesis